ncbi:hypothetical protein [Propionibacterium australiense]|nr:hypothetical protein [Propionibacterium australiense]RLP09476.1 hypothetical protein D9T14_06845 [Propionibacterium australiense]RLP09946.1 hypothetical protein D7U36_07195 [Propionibacterium australiense]
MAGPRIFDTLTLDGAPREAPSAFAQPKAEPLSSPARQPAVEVSGAMARPDAIQSPAEPGPALESLAPASHAPRDPHEPFESMSLLASSRPEEHDPREPFELSGGPTPSSGALFAPPDASSLVVPAAPGQQPPAAGQGRQTVNNYPMEGSWSGAGAAGPQETPDWLTGPLVILTDTGPRPYGVGNLLRATGVGMLWVLAIGFIVRPLALTALIVAWILSMTQSRSRRFLRAAFLVALGIMTLVILLTLLAGRAEPLSVGNSVARWVCLAMLLASPRLTRSDLARTGRLVTAAQARTMTWAVPRPPVDNTGHSFPNGAAGWTQPSRGGAPPHPVPGPPMHTAPAPAQRPGQPGGPQPPYPGYPGRPRPNG